MAATKIPSTKSEITNKSAYGGQVRITEAQKDQTMDSDKGG
jgi:hypothetical protein